MKSTILLSLLLVSSLTAQPLRPDLQMGIFGRAPIVDERFPDSGHGPVYFIDEPIVFQVDLAWIDSSIVPDASLVNWWEQLTVHLRTPDGGVKTVAREQLTILEVRVKGRTVLGTPQPLGTRPLPDATFVVFRLNALPPGNYGVRASMEYAATRNAQYRLRSPEEAFAIRRGDENEPVRRLFLRKRAASVAEYESFKAIQLDLLELEPNNSSILEAIADRSLNTAPAEETRMWFQRAYELRRAATDAALQTGQLAPDQRERYEASLVSLTIFEAIYDEYVEKPKAVRLVPFRLGSQKTYAWQDGETKTLRIINPERPHESVQLRR